MSVILEIIYLSSEFIYYNICIPMLFSQRNNVYINTNALITYSVILFLHVVLILFSYTYYKYSGDYHIYSRMIGYWKLMRASPEIEK